jgi:hypothetical protein
MDFLCSGLFWGTILVLLGASIILKAIFHINIPIVRTFFALILIYWGIRVLVGGAWCRTHTNTVLFSESTIMASDQQSEYSIIFGRGVIDTSALKTFTKDKPIRINTVFGASVIKIDRATPTLVKVNSAFAAVKLPDGNVATFGNYLYKNKAYTDAPDSIPRRIIELSTVFGNSIVDEM